MLSLRHSCLLAFSLVLLVATGCSESAKESKAGKSSHHDHEGHDHSHGPESLKDAISELTSLRDTIRDSFAKNDLDTADNKLHEVGHILESIPELAKKEQVSAENQTAVEAAVNTLMVAFGNVDKTMHGQEGSTYSEESETIDKTLTALTVACGIAAVSEEAAGEVTPAETPEPSSEGSEDPTKDSP